MIPQNSNMHVQVIDTRSARNAPKLLLRLQFPVPSLVRCPKGRNARGLPHFERSSDGTRSVMILIADAGPHARSLDRPTPRGVEVVAGNPSWPESIAAHLDGVRRRFSVPRRSATPAARDRAPVVEVFLAKELDCQARASERWCLRTAYRDRLEADLDAVDPQAAQTESAVQNFGGTGPTPITWDPTTSRRTPLCASPVQPFGEVSVLFSGGRAFWLLGPIEQHFQSSETPRRQPFPSGSRSSAAPEFLPRSSLR